MKREVFEELDMIGLNYYLMLPIKEVVDGIAHDADMVVVYCNEAMQEVFTNTFEKLYRTFDAIMIKKSVRKCHDVCSQPCNEIT